MKFPHWCLVVTTSSPLSKGSLPFRKEALNLLNDWQICLSLQQGLYWYLTKTDDSFWSEDCIIDQYALALTLIMTTATQIYTGNTETASTVISCCKETACTVTSCCKETTRPVTSCCKETAGMVITWETNGFISSCCKETAGTVTSCCLQRQLALSQAAAKRQLDLSCYEEKQFAMLQNEPPVLSQSVIYVQRQLVIS